MLPHLPPKQQRFVDELLADPALNATAAAIRAGYSEGSAKQEGYRLMQRPAVKAAIDAAIAERALRAEKVQAEAAPVLKSRQDRVLEELERLALCDIGEAYSAEGELLPFHEVKGADGKTRQMPESVRRAIVGIKAHELNEGSGADRHNVGLLREIRLADKVRAMELLMRHLGMFKADNQQIGESFADLVLEAQRRRQAKVAKAK